MTQMFKINLGDVIKFKQMMKVGKKEIRTASATVLDQFAIGTKRNSSEIINKEMTIRNKRFIKSRLRVTYAKKNQPVSSQISVIGSLPRDRFTGWVEQETGKTDHRSHVPTLLARGNNKLKQVKPSVRLNKPFISNTDFTEVPKGHRVAFMLDHLQRSRFRRPFIIKNSKKFKPGLYKFLRKKIVMIQSLDTPPRQPKRIKWLSRGVKQSLETYNVKKMWGEALKRVLRKKR